jgi:hypothetical protein
VFCVFAGEAGDAGTKQQLTLHEAARDACALCSFSSNNSVVALGSRSCARYPQSSSKQQAAGRLGMIWDVKLCVAGAARTGALWIEGVFV